MATQDFSDETLMAYVDGELDAETGEAVARAARADGAMADRIALFAATGAALADLRAARSTAKVPEALTARVRQTLAAGRGATETPPARRLVGESGGDAGASVPSRRASPGWAPLVAAACLALAVGLGAGLALRQGPAGGPAAPLAAIEGSGVAAALSRLGSGASQELAAGQVSLVSSFRTEAGTLCREFELVSREAAYVGVACDEAGAWSLRFVAATGAPGTAAASPGGGYAPAGTLEALDAWLSGIGAGPPLSVEAEREALGLLHE